jgi:type III pantothenate kinase
MIFAIDIGNSCVKCAVVDGDRVLGRETLETKRCQSATAVEDLVRRVASAVLSIERAIASSVVPSVTARFVRAVEAHIGQKPQIVDYNMRLPFRIAVGEPAQVGTDRLCAAAGALGLKRRNAIVIDAGSAITVDVIRDGAFLGGVIAAGPRIMLDSLHQHASQLPAIDFNSVPTPFPGTFDTTRTAMTLGAGLGCVGAIRESVRYLEASIGAAPRKYVTGGFGRVFSPQLPGSWHLDPDLTLKGLYTLASLNRRRTDRVPAESAGLPAKKVAQKPRSSDSPNK